MYYPDSACTVATRQWKGDRDSAPLRYQKFVPFDSFHTGFWDSRVFCLINTEDFLPRGNEIDKIRWPLTAGAEVQKTLICKLLPHKSSSSGTSAQERFTYMRVRMRLCAARECVCILPMLSWDNVACDTIA
jgi:hypothetical protein